MLLDERAHGIDVRASHFVDSLAAPAAHVRVSGATCLLSHTHPRTDPRMEHKRTPRQHMLRACRLLRIFFSTDAPHHARAVSGVFACPAPVELEGRHLRDLAGRCQLLHLVDVNLISWHEESEAGNGAALGSSVIQTPTDPAARWCSNPNRPQPLHTTRTLTNSQSS